MRDSILLVTGDEDLDVAVAEMLERTGWRVLRAQYLDPASKMLRDHVDQIAVVVCMERLTTRWGENGCDLYNIRSLDLQMNRIPFLLLTATTDPSFLAAAESYGMHTLAIPISPLRIVARVRTLARDPASGGNER